MGLAYRLEAVALKKAPAAAGGLYLNHGIATVSSLLEQGHQQKPAVVRAAQHAQHAQAVNPGHALCCWQQPCAGHSQTEPVAQQHVHRYGLIGIGVGRDHAGLGAQWQQLGRHISPRAHLGTGHRLTGFKTQHDLAQALRYGHRHLGLRVGKHIDQLAADQQLLIAKNAAHKAH